MHLVINFFVSFVMRTLKAADCLKLNLFLPDIIFFVTKKEKYII